MTTHQPRGTGRGRRLIGLFGVLAVVSTLFAACGDDGGASASSDGETVHVSVGRQPFAAGNSPITEYMMKEKLFEKAAEKLGQKVEVEYRDYPSALPMVEAMVGGKLDIGMWGNTPIVRAIAQGQGIVPLSIGEGHLRFIITTRGDSGIENMEDLKGKTIGVLLGGDPQAALTQMLRWTLGTANTAQLGIKLVNTPTQAVAATVPKGMDATVTVSTAYYQQRAKDDSVIGIANSFGYTEDGYRGPEGEGAGHLIQSVKQSPFYPDGFYLHRSSWVARSELLEEHPKVVTAFLVALEQATRELSSKDPAEVGELARNYWKLSKEDAAKVVKDELLFLRGWSWPTEADAWGLVWVSQFLAQSKIIDKPLQWQQVVDAYAKSAAVVKAAYNEAGSKPDAAEFTKSSETDLRGLPSWQYQQWRAPKSIAN
jgi:ABC-type nitrate/sulfonate/bicarbonate transport system substrate-binding protein